ncbi:MAG: hypothetical protein ACREBD_04335 [Blastocatellia bacterium]
MVARINPTSQTLAENPPYQPAQATQEEMRQALDRVLTSKHFAHAPMKQKFLRQICDFHLNGRGADLNEYLIGREVFDRDDSYNPATDPIVRVGAHGVREKLELYYQKEGANDEIRIEIPIGSYEPSFVRRPSLTAAQEVVVPAPSSPAIPATPAAVQEKWRLWEPNLAIAALLLVIAGLAYYSIDLRRQVRATAEGQEVYKLVWDPFLNNADPTLLVLSNPPVFRFINNSDPEVVVKKSLPLTAEQADEAFHALPNKSIIQIIQTPRLALTLDTYTGIGEAIGVHRVTDLFRSVNKSILLKQSRTASAEDLKDQNVIILGSAWVNNWSGKLPAKEDFVNSDHVTIQNLSPLPSERSEYKPVFDERTGKLVEDYALITISPNVSDKNTVMVLAGLHSEGTAAAAEYITGKHYLNELNQRLLQMGAGGGRPKHYQALLKVGVENGIPTTISLLSVHELRRRS